MAKDLRLEYQSLFIKAFQNASIGMTLLSPEGKWLKVNPAFCQFLGYTEEELLNTNFKAITHPDDIEADLQNKEKMLEGKTKTYQMEKRYIHKTGEIIWGSLNVSLVRDEQGMPLYFITQIQNITDQKLVESRLESFFKNNADAIWMVDLEDRVLEVNRTFEMMFGWKAEEVIGKRLPIIPEPLVDSMRELHNRVKSGESVIGFETVRQRKDRGTFHVSATLSPVRHGDGDIMGISGICRDITTRIWMEKEAKTAWEHLESFIENHVDAIILYSKEGRVIRVNQAFEELFGWSASEVLNEYVFDLFYIPENLKETELHQILDIVREGKSINIQETKRVNKNGDLIDVMLTGFPMNNLEGEFNGWSIVIRDITEWKKSQEMLQQSEKLSVAGQLAAGIAHEIRNPITSIKGFLQLMRTGFGQKQEYLDIMSAEIDRIEMILSELLILAKPQSTKYEHADLPELLESVIALLGTQGNLHNIRITPKFGRDIPSIECDKNQLKQVFINFIKNSMEAMPNGGEITIEVNRIADHDLQILFIDEGCGIPEEILAKIGQPFFTTKEKGTGLGFMISKKIIEDHKGYLKITSRVNEGTTIELHFPVGMQEVSH